MAAEESRGAEQLRQQQEAQAALSVFFLCVPHAQSELQLDSYRGDDAALRSFSQPPAKRNDLELLERNYLHAYLQYCSRGDDDAKLEAFMRAKLERERFTQWAGHGGATITQVTPAVAQLRSGRDAFDAALLNVFSAACKPINVAAFLRGVRARFRVTCYEARTRGPQGLFRPDMGESFTLARCGAGGTSVRGNDNVLLVSRVMFNCCGRHRLIAETAA
jgi:hypothetical protein